MQRWLLSLTMGGALLAATAAISPAQAALITTVSGPGNDCSGDLGTSPTCVLDIPGEIDRTVQITKADDFNDSDTPAGYETNPAFGSIMGNEFLKFSYNFTTDYSAGSWTYNQAAGDPVITAFTVKFGRGYQVYTPEPGGLMGIFDTGGRNVSHITFFDSAVPSVPVPATLTILGVGLAGIALAARRRRA